MILDKKEKQPVEVKSYPIDYTDWLAEIDDTIATATATVECLTDPSDTALVVSSLLISPTGVSPRLSGGTNGQRYKISITVTTVGGSVDQSEFIMRIKET